SLGVILFRCVAGALPFGGASLHEKFLGSTTAARPRLRAVRPELPRDAGEWVAQALAIDREERFGNVRALWNAFLETFDVRPSKRGKVPSLWDAAKRTRGRLAQTAEKPRADPLPDREAFGPSTSQRPPAQRQFPSAPP